MPWMNNSNGFHSVITSSTLKYEDEKEKRLKAEETLEEKVSENADLKEENTGLKKEVTELKEKISFLKNKHTGEMEEVNEKVKKMEKNADEEMKKMAKKMEKNADEKMKKMAKKMKMEHAGEMKELREYFENRIRRLEKSTPHSSPSKKKRKYTPRSPKKTKNLDKASGFRKFPKKVQIKKKGSPNKSPRSYTNRVYDFRKARSLREAREEEKKMKDHEDFLDKEMSDWKYKSND